MEISVRSRASSKGRSPQTGVGVSCMRSAGPGPGGGGVLSPTKEGHRGRAECHGGSVEAGGSAASPQSLLPLASLVKKNSSPGNREDRRGCGLGPAGQRPQRGRRTALLQSRWARGGPGGVWAPSWFSPAPPPPSPSQTLRFLCLFLLLCLGGTGCVGARAQPAVCTRGGDVRAGRWPVGREFTSEGLASGPAPLCLL